MSTEIEVDTVSQILQRIESPVIVELGAFGGEDSEWMRKACNDTHAINVMVEPDHRNCEIIRQYRRGVRTVLIEAAIADYTGMIDFYTSVDERCDGGRAGSGSIRNPAPHEKLFPEIAFREPQKVMCWSLDHLEASLRIPQIDLLWVDIQGAEREMIAGGQSALEQVRYLFIEAEETELYEGQALREELLGLLPRFEVIGNFDYNLLLRHR